LVLSQGCESLFKIDDESVGVSGLDDHVIHIGFNVLVELLLEADLDSSLVCSAVSVLDQQPTKGSTRGR
jgi:hypothetical protein